MALARARKKPTAPPGRREKALATRRRILRAASGLFCANGYAATTMSAIAAEADVAVQTLYFTFHTKGAILSETVGATIIGFERWDPRLAARAVADDPVALTALQPWFEAFDTAKSAAVALRVFVDASTGVLARVSPLVGVMAAAIGDPDVRAMSDVAERRRVETYQVVVAHLQKRGGLRRGVSLKRATDILLAVLSAETHQHLALRRAWSETECRAWFLDVLTHQLLPPG